MADDDPWRGSVLYVGGVSRDATMHWLNARGEPSCGTAVYRRLGRRPIAPASFTLTVTCAKCLRLGKRQGLPGPR